MALDNVHLNLKEVRADKHALIGRLEEECKKNIDLSNALTILQEKFEATQNSLKYNEDAIDRYLKTLQEVRKELQEERSLRIDYERRLKVYVEANASCQNELVATRKACTWVMSTLIGEIKK
jgi:chromosome segregation ATPase